jgi:hypothetical protein
MGCRGAPAVLSDYQRDHPRTARQLSERLLRSPFDGSGSSIRALERPPAVAFRPGTSACLLLGR